VRSQGGHDYHKPKPCQRVQRDQLFHQPPFQILVMSEESRLGREAIETAYALKQLLGAGVRVFFCLEDRERTLDSPTDKILLSLTAFADELEREKARQRVTDAMVRKAKAGQVTGGRVFGARGAGVPSAFSCSAIRFCPTPVAASSKIRRTTGASASLIRRSTCERRPPLSRTSTLL
jgi:DNA invertase Pin-like site-specific DNA recombinase